MKEKLNQIQKDTLLILYNRKKEGISMGELHHILNTSELLDKEKKLVKYKLQKLSKEE